MDKLNPLETLIAEMNSAAQAQLHIVALSVAVSIPAICASLSMKDGRSQGPEYKAWCEENLSEANGFRFLTPDEMYSIRCGLLHQARGEISSFYKGVTSFPYPHTGAIFTVENGWLKMGENSVVGQYVNSVGNFCECMGNAALDWINAQRENPIVQANLEKMMTYRPFKAQGISIDPAPQAIY
jgi:hypothetical protein